MRLSKTYRSDEEALLASTSREALQAGLYSARIHQATDKISQNGRPMIELVLAVNDGAGGTRFIKDWFVDSDIAAARLRSAVIAVNALAQYEASEISADDFLSYGQDIVVRLAVRKQRRYPDSNTVVSYHKPAAAPVLRLHPAE
jgi:hypothetical protein